LVVARLNRLWLRRRCRSSADVAVGRAPDECDDAGGLAAVEGAGLRGGAAVVVEALGAGADFRRFVVGDAADETAGAGVFGLELGLTGAERRGARGEGRGGGGEGENASKSGDGSEVVHDALLENEVELEIGCEF